VSATVRYLAAAMIESGAPEFIAKHVRPAFSGDVDAAYALSALLPNRERGWMARTMWRTKVPRPAFRAFFSCVWDHDHREVIAAAETRRRLAFMFRYADFPLPDWMPDTVRAWRGTSALPFAEAAAGYSWTTDRDTACWFAMRFAERNGSPLVLAADIPKSDIVLFHTLRNESEAVTLKPPVAVIDGTPVDWRTGYDRFEVSKNRM
jgi:hypothetical protein